LGLGISLSVGKDMRFVVNELINVFIFASLEQWGHLIYG